MSLNSSLAEKIQTNEKRLKELMLASQRNQDQYENIVQETGLNAEEIRAYAENPDHYTPEEWEEMNQERKEFFAFIHAEMDKISNPKKTQATQSQRAAVRPHWLFVR